MTIRIVHKTLIHLLTKFTGCWYFAPFPLSDECALSPLCICVCRYVYIYIYIYIYICICTHTYIHHVYIMNIFIYVCLYAHMHFFLNLLNTSCMVFYSYTSTCIFSTNQNTVLHTNRFKIDFFPLIFHLYSSCVS